ncbi:MAG TPA: sigma-54 dependent transcriptional regulator [Fibrobacteria bacterium]|nr:sigma-54 dependent transcriptional regulator [Fibrobacteria bacterium]
MPSPRLPIFRLSIAGIWGYDGAMGARRILVVDDEKSLCDYLAILLRREGYLADVTVSVDDAISCLSRVRYDGVLSDLMIGQRSGMEIVNALRGSHVPVVLMTAYGTVEKAVEALRQGASDFILKPFQNEVLVKSLRDVVERASGGGGPDSADSRASTATNRLDQDLSGVSPVVDGLRTLVTKIGPTESTVLITGESGTGKEVVARALHRLSPRAARPFLPIHCAALSEGLLESELFGHVKGSYTGAVADSAGLFVAAKGGTVFLDEVGEIPLSTQVKLLRVLQEREVTPVGGLQPVSIDVRIVSATNADLEVLVSRGRFREDLFYRLNVIRIRTPSLRDRSTDLPDLSRALLQRIGKRLGRPAPELSPEAARKLTEHHWPGNIRELENVLERALVLCAGTRLEESDIALGSRSNEVPPALASIPPALEEVQKAYIFWILTQTGWRVPQAAKILGIEPERLQRMTQHYGINDPRIFQA